MYYFELGEQEYPTFKRDNHINVVVEFHDFPHRIIEFLELCLQSKNIAQANNNALDGKSNSSSNIPPLTTTLTSSPSTSSSRLLSICMYNTRLDITTGILHFVETNHFKQTILMTLQLKAGDDAAIKLYLASRLALSLQYLRERNHTIENLNQQLTDAKEKQEQSDQEILKLK